MKDLIKRSAVFAIILVSFLATFSSCKKERLDAQSGGDYSSPSAFYNQYQQQEQVFTVDSPGVGPIIGQMGTKWFGDRTIFMFPDSQDITYPFILKMTEIYPAKDMILSNLPTVGGGNILESGGEIRIRAFKNNIELVLKPGKKYYMELDTSATPLLNGMSVYYGFNNGSITDWTNNIASLDPSISPDTLSSVTNQPLFYAMNVARVGWANCARLFSASPTTTLTFTSKGTNIQNIDIFLVFKNIKSVMKVYNLQSGAIPVGTELTVVAIAKDQNQSNALVYDSQAITVSSNQQITLDMKTISDQDLLNILSAL